MSDDDWDRYPTLAHSLVAAKGSRVRAFVDRYAEMAKVVSVKGPDAPESGEAQFQLLRRLSAWGREDYAAELSDMVDIVGHELDDVRRGLRHALEYLEFVEEEDRSEVEARLRDGLERLDPMPRSCALRLARCVQRLDRLCMLQAPQFLLGNEARLIAQQLRLWKTPPQPWVEEAGWVRGCQGLLRAGIEACTIFDATGNNVDLGLGLSQAVDDLLGIGDADYEALNDAWEGPDGLALECILPAVAAYPLVPQGRAHDLGPSFAVVRDHGEMAGPIGWAAGEDVLRLAQAYTHLARTALEHETALLRTADNLRAVHRRGEAVFGCLEWLERESDGHRAWLVELA